MYNQNLSVSSPTLVRRHGHCTTQRRCRDRDFDDVAIDSFVGQTPPPTSPSVGHMPSVRLPRAPALRPPGGQRAATPRGSLGQGCGRLTRSAAEAEANAPPPPCVMQKSLPPCLQQSSTHAGTILLRYTWCGRKLARRGTPRPRTLPCCGARSAAPGRPSRPHLTQPPCGPRWPTRGRSCCPRESRTDRAGLPFAPGLVRRGPPGQVSRPAIVQELGPGPNPPHFNPPGNAPASNAPIPYLGGDASAHASTY